MVIEMVRRRGDEEDYSISVVHQIRIIVIEISLEFKLIREDVFIGRIRI